MGRRSVAMIGAAGCIVLGLVFRGYAKSWSTNVRIPVGPGSFRTWAFNEVRYGVLQDVGAVFALLGTLLLVVLISHWALARQSRDPTDDPPS